MNKVFCIGELLIDFINKDINAGLVKGINFEKKAGGAPANVCAAVCKLGGKYPFVTLLKKAHLRNPFEDGNVRKVIRPCVKILNNIDISKY